MAVYHDNLRNLIFWLTHLYNSARSEIFTEVDKLKLYSIESANVKNPQHKLFKRSDSSSLSSGSLEHLNYSAFIMISGIMQIKDTESEPRPWGAFTAMKLLAWKLVARKCSYETTISNFITWWIPICTPIVHCMVSLLVCITNSPNGFFHWFLARNQQLIKEWFFCDGTSDVCNWASRIKYCWALIWWTPLNFANSCHLICEFLKKIGKIFLFTLLLQIAIPHWAVPITQDGV